MNPKITTIEHKKELNDSVKIADNISVAKAPIKAHLSLKEKCATALCTAVHIASGLLLVLSGIIIIRQYPLIVLGNMPTAIEKITLDYSFTVFAGCAIYQLLYRAKLKEIINEILHVKEVPNTSVIRSK